MDRTEAEELIETVLECVECLDCRTIEPYPSVIDRDKEGLLSFLMERYNVIRCECGGLLNNHLIGDEVATKCDSCGGISNG